jgi:Lon protease-like protein
VTHRVLPLFPLGTVLFPAGPLALRIFEPRYVDMVSRCLRESTGFVVVLLVEGQQAGGGALTTAATGTEAEIVDFDRLDDGLLGLTCVGRQRTRIVRAWRQDDGLNVGEVEDVPADSAAEVPQECAHLPEALRRLYPDLDPIYSHVPPRWDDAAWVGNRLAELAPLEGAVKQGLLELEDPVERLRYLAPLIRIDPDKVDA